MVPTGGAADNDGLDENFVSSDEGEEESDEEEEGEQKSGGWFGGDSAFGGFLQVHAFETEC
jgi:hypothetical protein